jgi:hypothetical protein
MCSEELISDLELFINRGLAKGLRGWPAKGQECCVEGDRGNQWVDWRRYDSRKLGETATKGIFEGIGAF